ncbi:type II secretion system F family protein [Nocardioides sp. zg-DK7169]|uniref:type II secretion system F family protein n=1 Tax=Nocardioides sp. zg-DK7169 TaxID=2736600 RepID=UPI001554728C|nr:type II secretion system F family protein [Nocardioides sp. zg-DK7169]NPC98269.1 type II secretion system F family protein [Nocardioides sp. zg-DK7169]
MGAAVLLAALAAAGAVALALPSRGVRLPVPAAGAPAADPVTAGSSGAPPDGWMLRWRPLWCLLVGAAAAVFVGGSAGPVAGAAGAAATWVGIARAEPPARRRAREAVLADLPHVVSLLGAALRSGTPPDAAVAAVCAALPGAAADRLAPVSARLALGVEPVAVWQSLAEDPELAPLGRAMARAQSTGAPVVRSVERLADELAASARAAVEDRARAVGVRAALPLGLCLLPAFVLVGIVPLVAGLLGTLGL